VSQWQQGIDLAVGAGRETFQDTGQPLQRIEPIELGGGQQALDRGSGPARSEPANSQFFLPIAIGRIEFSTGLLSIGRVPLSAKRSSASQRLSA
jgi:hypothetical protein